MDAPRILTFNFHEPYLCLMARTGLPFTIGVYEQGFMARQWHTHYRPIPPTLAFAPEASWRADLRAGKFDVVIAQNESNAANICEAVVSSRTPPARGLPQPPDIPRNDH